MITTKTYKFINTNQLPNKIQDEILDDYYGNDTYTLHWVEDHEENSNLCKFLLSNGCVDGEQVMLAWVW